MRTREKLFWLLTSFATVSSIGSSMITPYLPLFGEDIGMSIGLVGYLVFINYAVATATRIPIGSLSDRLDCGKVLLGGAFSLVLAGCLYLLSAHMSPLLFVGQIFFGLGTSITWVTIPAIISGMPDSVSKYTFLVGLGWLAGPPLGGYIRDALGMDHLFWVFLALSIGLAALAGTFMRIYKAKKGGGKPHSRQEANPILATFAQAVTLAKDRHGVLLAGVSSFVMFMTFAMGVSLLPIHFTAIGMLSFHIGLLQSLRTISSTSIRLAFAVIKQAARRVLGIEDEAYLLIFSMGLIGVPILLLPMTESRPLMMLLLVLWGLSGGLYLPIMINLIGDSTDSTQRGIAMGLQGSMGTLGSALGVLVLSNLAEAYSVQLALSLLGLFVMLFSAALFLYQRRHELACKANPAADCLPADMAADGDG